MKKIEKNQKERKEQKSGQMYCPVCHLSVAPLDSQKIKTASGVAHTNCAMAEVARLLVGAGLPKPAGCKDIGFLKFYLKRQTTQLLDLPAADPVVERKLAAIHEAAGYLLIQFNLPASIKKARPTALH